MLNDFLLPLCRPVLICKHIKSFYTFSENDSVPQLRWLETLPCLNLQK